jgi:hypothetical protein
MADLYTVAAAISRCCQPLIIGRDARKFGLGQINLLLCVIPRVVDGGAAETVRFRIAVGDPDRPLRADARMAAVCRRARLLSLPPGDHEYCRVRVP